VSNPERIRDIARRIQFSEVREYSDSKFLRELADTLERKDTDERRSVQSN
jgi:hypothetical protein